MRDFYVDGSTARVAWAEGRATCPECKRVGCRGQCGCPCRSCKETPVASWTSSDCDVIRDMRRRQTPEGREEVREEYRAQLAGRSIERVSWGECVAQVERSGCPHETVRAARAPQPWPAMASAKDWWSRVRGAKPTILFSGGTGVGKSVAAAHLCAKFAEARKWWTSAATGSSNMPLVWFDAGELARQALLRDVDQYLIQRAEVAEMLVVDELGVSGAKSGLLALGQLLARRIDSGRLTIITTNASGETLKEPLGAHVVDRMKRAHVVKLDEKSRRVA